jgi:hypothetical protein
VKHFDERRLDHEHEIFEQTRLGLYIIVFVFALIWGMNLMAAQLVSFETTIEGTLK